MSAKTTISMDEFMYSIYAERFPTNFAYLQSKKKQITDRKQTAYMELIQFDSEGLALVGKKLGYSIEEVKAIKDFLIKINNGIPTETKGAQHG